jgi:phenylpropionate dioxygenase-like ring-hydroxylating dioxygenase large terminal subunit
VDYYYERSIENGLDPAHNEFVHPTHGFKAVNRETYKVREFDVENHPQNWGMWFVLRFNAPGLQDETWKDAKTKPGELYAGTGTHGPNSMITEINVGKNQKFRQYFFEQPVDQDKTRIFFVNMRNFMLEPEKDGPIHARNKVIAQQDIEILSDVYPRATPSNTREVLVNPGDKAVSAYRTWLQKFDEKGWRIDTETFYANNGRTRAFAIPSPARRNSGNWVLDPMPLLKNHEARKQRNWNVA